MNAALSNITNLLKKIDDTSEFEIMFYNYKSNNKLSIIKFMDLLNYVKYINDTNQNVKIYNNISLDVIYAYSNVDKYRFSINGLDKINNILNMLHQRNNSIIFSVLSSQYFDKSYCTFVNKIKDIKNMIDYDEYDIRARLSQEVPIKKDNLSKLQNLQYVESKKIVFRFKQRLSMILFENEELGTLQLDLTIVKTANTPDKIEEANKEFEVELEYTRGTSLNKKMDIISNIIIENIIKIKQVLEKAFIVTPKSEYNNVLLNYKKITYKYKFDNQTNLYSMHPISTEVNHFIDNIPNIYSVTDKSDGDKYQLYVFNNSIYLVSNNLNIIKTKYQSTLNNTIMEGEWIKHNNKYLMMIYDCLYYNNVDIRIIQSHKTRLEYVFKFIESLKIDYYKIPIVNDSNLTEQKNKYEKYILEYYKKLNNVLENSKFNDIIFYPKLFIFPTGVNNSEVFLYSYLIWSLCVSKNTQCPYFIDGIIFTPLEQIYTRDKKEQKHKIYKYKPPHMNSIDVYLVFKKKAHSNAYLETYDNTLNCFDNNKTFRVANLYVGDNINGKEIPVPFLKEENNHEVYFPLESDEVRDIEGNLVTNESVVELIYVDNKNTPHQYRWKILKTRWDKTESVIRDNKQYGNFKEFAIKIWKSMKEAVTVDEIKNLSDPELYNNYQQILKNRLDNINSTNSTNTEKVYYQKVSDLGSVFRAFHNWIKSCLIYNYLSYECSKEKIVLDIGCGRGGDIEKWYRANAKKCVCIDPDYEGLFGFVDSATIRYNAAIKKFQNFPEMKFIQADATTSFDIESQEKLITKMTKENKKLLLQELNGQQKFNIISYQFSIHYLFQSEESVKNVIEINNKYLEKGGYIICTLMDPLMVNKLLEKDNTYTAWYMDENGEHKKFFEIIKRFNGPVKNTYGQMIDVFMSWVSHDNTTLPEFLVTKEYLVNVMNKSNCKLIDTEKFANLYSLNKQWFMDTINYEENGKNKKYYQNVSKIYEDSNSNENRVWNNLFRYYIFKKM